MLGASPYAVSWSGSSMPSVASPGPDAPIVLPQPTRRIGGNCGCDEGRTGYVLTGVYPRRMSVAEDVAEVWVPFVRSEGPSWTSWDVAAMIGDRREVDWHGGLGFDRIMVRILDGRLTTDPRIAEFLVVPA